MSNLARKAFRLEADDVLFFRDGRPSSQGQDHYLRSLFPPFPSTLYGALRTHRLLAEGVDLGGLDATTWVKRLGPALVAELGDYGAFGSLALRGPWLVRRKGGADELLLPAPLDLVVTTEPDGPLRVRDVGRFRPLEGGGGSGGQRWSHPLAALSPHRRAGSGWALWPPAEAEPEPRSAAGWFLTPGGFGRWRSGDAPAPADFVWKGDLWLEEPRTGVGLRRDLRAAEEHQLYTFGFVRLLPDVALGFEASGTKLAAPATLRLGGEGRTARLEPGPPFPWQAPAASGRFILAFATPALSEAGAWPPGFAAGQKEGTIAKRRCRLVSAIVPGAMLVGGWDLARERPKPLRRALPAGSVFFFEQLEPETAVAAEAADPHNLSDFGGEHLARQGFGLALAGAWT